MDEVGGDLRAVGGFREYDTVLRDGLRGKEITVRFMAETEGTQDEGRFFDANKVLVKPPEPGLLETHDEAIRKVASTYRSLRADRS
jgi:hypothetical protein